jgi:hypothetical protein
LFDIAETGQPVLAPAIRSRPGMVVGEIAPGVAVGAVVLADRAPLPFAEVGAPQVPVAGVPKALVEAAETIGAATFCAGARHRRHRLPSWRSDSWFGRGQYRLMTGKSSRRTAPFESYPAFGPYGGRLLVLLLDWGTSGSGRIGLEGRPAPSATLSYRRIATATSAENLVLALHHGECSGEVVLVGAQDLLLHIAKGILVHKD